MDFPFWFLLLPPCSCFLFLLHGVAYLRGDRIPGSTQVIASDVIYGVTAVPSLLAAIAAVSRPGRGRVLVATRDGRRGVSEFRAAMEASNAFSLEEILLIPNPKGLKSEHQSHKASRQHANDPVSQKQQAQREREEESPDKIPEAFAGNRSRWEADHSVYVFLDVRCL